MENEVFRIAVCDDLQTDKEETVKIAREICAEENICSEILCFSRAGELLRQIEKENTFDLLIVDVLMPDMNGIELARLLRQKKEKIMIVFISCNREMAMQGYEVEAVRYLAKPLDREKMKEAILFCYRHQKNQEMILPVGSSMRKVAPDDIYYIEIVGRKCRIVQKEEMWDVRLPMAELEGLLLGKGFVKCHQSFLVNLRHVKNFRTSSLEFADGRSVPVSKHRLKEVRKAFFEYIKN